MYLNRSLAAVFFRLSLPLKQKKRLPKGSLKKTPKRVSP